MNPHIHSLLETLERRYSPASRNLSTYEWLHKYTKFAGKSFSTEGYNFQRDILNDNHPSMAVIKLSQVGLTHIQIHKALSFLTRNQGLQGAYSLPDKSMRDRVSNTRIRPVLDQNKVFNPEVIVGSKPRRSVDLMQIGNSFLHVTLATESAATSTPLDLIMVDEVDLTDSEILALYESRLQNSNFKIRHDFGTPTFDGYGIDAAYSQSDRREYLCKCDACNHWQLPDWSLTHVRIRGLPTSLGLDDITFEILPQLDLQNSFVACEKCNSPLNLASENRQWVAENPANYLTHGYRVRPFSTSKITIGYIVTQLMKYKNRDKTRGFYNTVLGRTYKDAKARLQDSDIRACLMEPEALSLSSSDPVFVGIDVGQLCHITIGTGTSINNFRVVEFKIVPVGDLISEVGGILKKYRVVRGAIDRFPYTPTAEEVRDLSNGKIFPVEYTQGSEIDEKEQEGYYRGNRTKIIDVVAKKVRTRTLEMNGYGQYREMIVEHLMDMVRVEEPEEQAIWKKLNKQDHFFHSLGFLLFSVRIQEYIKNEELSSQDNRTAVGLVGIKLKHQAEGFSRKPNTIMYPTLGWRG